MRVGVITTSYPRWAGDAAGSFVAGHVAYLRGAPGIDSVEIIAAGDDQVDAAWDEREQVHRVTAPRGLFYAGGAPEAIDAGSGLAALMFAARLTAKVVMRNGEWDAVVAHWLAPCAMAAVGTSGPLLAIAHGGDVHLLAGTKMLGGTLKVLERRDARLVFVSDVMRARALEAYPGVADRSIVQPMGIDAARFAPIAEARAARVRGPDDPITILMLARLVPIKAVDVAIEAMARLPSRYRLVVAGDGPLREPLAALARTREVDDRVELVGWLDADARDRALADADVVAVTSTVLPGGRAEGTPLAALEALTAGVPLVATSTGGLPALEAHGAIVIPSRDPDALALAIQQAAAAPRAPVGGFDWATVGAALDAHWRRTA